MSESEKESRWLGKYVPYLIYRITGHQNRKLRRRLKKSGINIARWRVLAVLQDQVALNIGQIAEHTLIEQPTVSRIVDQLEREGLAVRESDSKDSRFVHVVLTGAGKSAFDEIYPIAVKHQEQALMGFKQQEIKTLIGYLERIQNNISTTKPPAS
jgi:DNA-binding MarR family transcriptional regulator